MSSQEEDRWECRLCTGPAMSAPEMSEHLAIAHGFSRVPGEAVLTGRLHAALDYPQYSENTLGFYRGEELICIVVQRRQRAADDPMRFEDVP